MEENPGPTIFDIIDSIITVYADYSQGNEALFGENAGKQCVANLAHTNFLSLHYYYFVLSKLCFSYIVKS